MNRFLPLFTFLLLLSSVLGDDKSPKQFKPHIPIEVAIGTARRAFEKNQFNPKHFEIRNVKYAEKFSFDNDPESIAATNLFYENFSKEEIPRMEGQIKTFAEEFGDGPLWIVSYWRTDNHLKTGEWYDAVWVGLTFLVFDNNRVAIIDRRWKSHPEDQIDKTK